MTIFINPGSGPVTEVSEAAAWVSMGAFVMDLREDLKVMAVTRTPLTDEDGRYGFALLFEDGRRVEIDMPGLMPDKVRWLSEESGNIWDFPRLYVDGSSWIWAFALNCCEPDDEGDSE